jgi:hypothetical protein
MASPVDAILYTSIMTKKLDTAIKLGTVIMDEAQFMAITGDDMAASRMNHGQLHELVFHQIPGSSEWTDAIRTVLGINVAYRCVSTSSDRLTYVIEEVDVLKTLDRTTYTPSADTVNVKAYLKCHTCGTGYSVYRIVNRKHDSIQQKYNYYTIHCPACPPMSTDAWLAEHGFWLKPPPAFVPNTDTETEAKYMPTSSITINIDEFE